MTAVVPMHPEATADPQTLRWVIPAGTLPVVGEIADAPDELGDLLRSGDISSLEVEAQAVLIRLSDALHWSAAGARIRDALATALQHPEHWKPSTAVTEDDLLRAALEDVLAGPAGDYIRSHGGEVTIVTAHDRCAEVRMSGTCAHCPAAGFTLHSRLESELRARFPSLRELRATETPTKQRRAWLPLPGRRPA